MICAFITEHKDRFGVAPMARALSAHGVPIAPRTYYPRLSRPPSARALWDMVITEVLAGVYQPGVRGRRPPESLYGRLKMWAPLRRQPIPVAGCTVERLMHLNGWRGVSRARTIRTTVGDPAAARAPTWSTGGSARRGPTSCTSRTSPTCRWCPGFGYSTFLIDAFAGLIVGWECSASKETAFVERACARRPSGAGMLQLAHEPEKCGQVEN